MGKRKSASRIPFKRKGVKMSTAEYADRLRKNMTPSEKTLWKSLRKRMKYWGVVFRPQVVVLGFIPDFYCDDPRLAIEVDGPIHMKAGVRLRDMMKTRKLNRAGVQVLRFTNYQVLHRIDDVLRAIEVVVQGLR